VETSCQGILVGGEEFPHRPARVGQGGECQLKSCQSTRESRCWPEAIMDGSHGSPLGEKQQPNIRHAASSESYE